MAGLHGVAGEALALLHSHVAAGAFPAGSGPSEGEVLRHRLACQQAEAAQQRQALDTEVAAGTAAEVERLARVNELHVGLAALLNSINKRCALCCCWPCAPPAFASRR